jgi:phosphoglycerate kinase
MAKLQIDAVEFRNKRVLVRLDLNAPLSWDSSDGPSKVASVADDSRLLAALPTVKKISTDGGIAILLSHLGRPGGKINNDLSLRPIAVRLAALLGQRVTFVPDLVGTEVKQIISEAIPGDIILLENTRFYPGETKNDPELARQLAELGDIFVNDAFGTAHRAHASTEGVARLLKISAMGYLMEKELSCLSRLLSEPEKPFMGILGGAKVSDKIALIEQLLFRVDSLLVGGAMAYTFLKAQGHETGNSLVEKEYLDMAAHLLTDAGDRLILPTDHIVATAFSNDVGSTVSGIDIKEGEMGLDIGPETRKIFRKHILQAQTLVWNGPMGVFEMSNFSAGTLAVAESISEVTRNGAFTVVGGGDSVAAIKQAGFTDQVSHVSTGGGAMLEFLEGKILPGIEALSTVNP